MLFFPTRDLLAWLDLLPVNDTGHPARGADVSLAQVAYR